MGMCSRFFQLDNTGIYLGHLFIFTLLNELQMVKLKALDKFVTTADALGAVNHIVDGKLPKGLCKFLKAECQGETLMIADSKLGKAISEKLVCQPD